MMANSMPAVLPILDWQYRLRAIHWPLGSFCGQVHRFYPLSSLGCLFCRIVSVDQSRGYADGRSLAGAWEDLGRSPSCQRLPLRHCRSGQAPRSLLALFWGHQLRLRQSQASGSPTELTVVVVANAFVPFSYSSALWSPDLGWPWQRRVHRPLANMAQRTHGRVMLATASLLFVDFWPSERPFLIIEFRINCN